MYSIQKLEEKKENIRERKQLPIQQFIGWDGLERLIDSHIEALKKANSYNEQLSDLIGTIYEHANEGTALMELAEKYDEEI